MTTRGVELEIKSNYTIIIKKTTELGVLNLLKHYLIKLANTMNNIHQNFQSAKNKE